MKWFNSLIAALIFIFLISCSENRLINSFNSIKGSKILVTEVRSLPIIHSVHIATAGKVIISQGPEQEVSVTVDDNIMQYIETKVSNGTLVIGIEKNISVNDFDLTVNIKMSDLEALTTSSAGTIEGNTTFIADNVSLVLNSAGNIMLDLEADRLLSILSSAGNLFLDGTVTNHHAVVSSAGNLHAFNMIADSTTVTVSSAGNAEVYVTDFLDAIISSVGSVYYKGNPASIHETVTSLGRLVNSN